MVERDGFAGEQARGNGEAAMVERSVLGRRIAAVLTSVGLMAGLLAAGAGPATAQVSMVALGGNVLRGVDHWASLGSVPASQVIHVGVGLTRPDRSAEDAFIASLNDPGSANYHHYLTPAEFNARFGVSRARRDAAIAWLRSGGLKAETVGGATDYVVASGTAAQVANLFATPLQRFRSSEGEFYANTAAPQVPADLGVSAIAGLNSLEGPRTANVTLAGAPAPSAPSVPPETGLTTPPILWDVYNQPANNKGEGQRMAIFGWGDTTGVETDLRQFEAEYNLPATPISITHYGTEAAITDTGGAVEWRLDTQASLGMAPNVVGESLYFGKEGTDDDLIAAYDGWVNDPAGPLQGSSSFSGCEETPATAPLPGGPGNPGGLITIANNKQDLYEQALTQAVAEGRTMFASTGDTGSSCPAVAVNVNGVGNEAVPLLGYPAASPHAVGVGGTVLYWNDGPPASRSLEYAWTYTGGGTSQFLAAGDYQNNVPGIVGHCVSDPHGVPYTPPGPLCRGIPDVAAQSGDIATNGYTITVNGANDQAGGGTSLSSPLWLGMWTRIQAAAADPVKGLGFANPVLYNDAKDAANYATDFFDVTTGCNGYYCATPGWDYVSGWGSPNVTSLMTHLAGKTAPTNPLPPAAAPTARAATFDPCSPTLWTDAAGDESFTLGTGGPYPQLDLLSGNMAVSPDGANLVTTLTLNNLSKSVPPPGGTNQYYALFNFKDTTFFTNAQVDSTGAVTYSDGQIILTGSTRRYTKRSGSADTGTFNEGPNGTITVTAPLSAFAAADKTTPQSGDVLGSPSGETYVTVGSPTGSPASLQPIDTGGPVNDYKVGQVCTPQNAQSGPRVLVSPSAVSFSNQAKGTTGSPVTLTVRNIGDADVTLGGLTVAGTNGTPATDFVASADTCSGTIVHVGATCTAQLTFTPGDVGPRTGTLTVTSNDPTGPQVINLSGTGTTPVPEATPTPASLGFGAQKVGASSDPQTVTITNTGAAPLTITSLTLTGDAKADYGVNNDTCSGATIAAGASCTAKVQFAPTNTGTRTASLDIADNAADSPQSVSLVGTGIGSLTWTPGSISFGDQKQFASTDVKSVTFTNNGGGTVVISAAAIGGTAAGDFTIADNTCTGASLTPAASCTISVRFRPSALGSRSASLTVTDNATGSPQSIPLSGNGVIGAGPTAGQGYWLVASDGGIFTFGSYRFFGSTGAMTLNSPIVGMAVTPDRQGYWLVASDGGIFTFGDARFFGSTGNLHLNKPIVGIASTPDGGGYWMVASDGGIFAFGNAKFLGSQGAKPLNKPVVAMSATPSGAGYWMVASDGGIFTFGDATFQGSQGGKPLNKPIVGMAPTPTGGGYWMVASDGGIFTFGDAKFLGSQGAKPLNKPVVGMTASPTGAGYWMDATDGGIFTFGDAIFAGSMGGQHLNLPTNGMAS